MEIVTKVYLINKPDDKKKLSYEVRDNLLRFYKNKSALQMLGAEAFYEEYVEESLVTFISHRFEEIARTYFSLCVQKRKLCGIRSSRFSPMRVPSVTERRFPFKTDAGTLLYPGLDCLRSSALQSASRL